MYCVHIQHKYIRTYESAELYCRLCQWACFRSQFLGVMVTTNMYLPEAPRISLPTIRPSGVVDFFDVQVEGQSVALSCVRLLILRTVFKYIIRTYRML